MNPIPVHAANPGPMTGAGNWTWLLPGRVPTLIDAGTGDARHLEAVREALRADRLSQVLVTHGHTDHASGAPALAALDARTRFRKFPWPDRDGRWDVGWHGIADGESIECGDTTLVAVHTPGHAPDHLCFWHPETRVIFGGDLVLDGATVYIPTSLRGDLTAYLASLARVRSLEPVRLYPAHGPVIDEPVALIDHYVAHRAEREAQVLAVLAAGPATPDDVVRRLYRGLAERLRPMARETALAHLVKLESEGRVARGDADRWHMISP